MSCANFLRIALTRRSSSPSWPLSTSGSAGTRPPAEHVDRHQVSHVTSCASAGCGARDRASASLLLLDQEAREAARPIASSRNAKCGMPGIIPSTASTAAVTISTCGCEELGEELLARVLALADAAHDEAGRG